MLRLQSRQEHTWFLARTPAPSLGTICSRSLLLSGSCSRFLLGENLAGTSTAALGTISRGLGESALGILARATTLPLLASLGGSLCGQWISMADPKWVVLRGESWRSAPDNFETLPQKQFPPQHQIQSCAPALTGFQRCRPLLLYFLPSVSAACSLGVPRLARFSQ